MKKIEDKQFTTEIIYITKKNWIFWRKGKKKHKKQHYFESSSEDSESEYYIPKKRNPKNKMIKKYKRSHDWNENDHDNVDGTVVCSKERENFDDDYEDDDGDDYDVDYKETNQTK